ncbi:MAG: nicotianamine synthase family protein [Hyphomicrobiaceae bacterium]
MQDFVCDDTLTRFADQITEILECGNTRSADVIAALTRIGRQMTVEQGDQLVATLPRLSRLRTAAQAHYRDFIYEAERLEIEQLRGEVADGPFDLGYFGATSYARVRDMFKHIDFANCCRFVLVGCGALPVTMFQVYDRTSVPEIVGLDTRLHAIDCLQSLATAHDMPRLRPVLCDGQHYDYAGSDVIFIANLVSPKRQVLESILETAPTTAQIVLRDPYSIGRLFTECGAYCLPPGLRVAAVGASSPAYFSRNVFLRPGAIGCGEYDAEGARARELIDKPQPLDVVESEVCYAFAGSALFDPRVGACVASTERRRCLIVGSGPFPDTALLLHAIGARELACLDVSQQACSLSTGVFEAMDCPFDVEHIVAEATEWTGYGDYDVVMVNALVSPKPEALRNIAEHLPPHATVLARSGFGLQAPRYPVVPCDAIPGYIGTMILPQRAERSALIIFRRE